jgi:hypothetical protein
LIYNVEILIISIFKRGIQYKKFLKYPTDSNDDTASTPMLYLHLECEFRNRWNSWGRLAFRMPAFFIACRTVLLAKWLVELLLSMLQDIALHTPLWYNQFIKITVKEEQYA